MRFLTTTASLGCALFLSACVCGLPPEKAKEEKLYLKPVAFSALPGWSADDAGAALAPFEKSCARILKKAPDANFGAGGFAGKAEAWQEACKTLPQDGANARAWFENVFRPYAIYGDAGAEGLFTGYYEPLLHGSLEQKPPYTVPLYARPASLITANLGDFSPDLKGKTITGRVEGEKFVPYYTREQIEDGALKDGEQIVWVDNAVDAFFLHIQGSGEVAMENGEVLHVGYAAQNGKPYTAIGREMIRRGYLTKENVSMQAIRAWLEAHPKEAPEVMNVNASYVFFRKLDGEGPLGAEGVALTPGRSLAVDNKQLPYGLPLWLDAESPDKTARLQRLMVAQDTGGAIRGAVRGDFFWGAGPDATENAGKMKSKGAFYALLPKGVEVPKSKQWRWWRALLTSTKAPKISYNK